MDEGGGGAGGGGGEEESGGQKECGKLDEELRVKGFGSQISGERLRVWGLGFWV